MMNKVDLLQETEIIYKTAKGYILAAYGSLIFDNIEEYLTHKLSGFGYHKIRLVSLHSLGGLVYQKVFYTSKSKLEGSTYLALNCSCRSASLAAANHEILQLMDLFENVCKDIMGLPVIFTRKLNHTYFIGIMTQEGVVEVANGKVLKKGNYYVVSSHFFSRVLEAMCYELIDEKGLIMSPSITPYSIGLIPIKRGEPGVNAYALEIKDKLLSLGVNCLYENLNETHLVTFTRYVKMGIPVIVKVGTKDLNEHKINVFFLPDLVHERLNLAEFYENLEAILKRVHFEIVKRSTQKMVNYIRNAKEISPTALVNKVYYCDKCIKSLIYDELNYLLLQPFNQAKVEKCSDCQAAAHLYYLIRKLPHLQ